MADIDNNKTIILSQGMQAIVDPDDYEHLSKWKWHFHLGYAVRNCSLSRCMHCGFLPRKMLYMHRVVCDAPKGLDVDHINRNKLDNRRINLRAVTREQNCRNSRRKNKKYKGVYWIAKRKKWRAAINYKGKYIEIGSFDTQEQAASAYNKRVYELYGEHAYLNPIEEAQPGRLNPPLG